jgi:hypothetical protein
LIESAPAPEFLLAAACCRWPRSERHAVIVRAAAQRITDWDRFMRVVKRHRVPGLVWDALRSAAVALPPRVADQLESLVQHHVRRSLRLAAETSRLQNLLDAAGIAAVALKGAALEQLAYSSLSLKQTRDIDLLVPPDRAETALQLLERDGYTLSLPAKKLSRMQRRALIRYGREIELFDLRRKLRVELQWRAADNLSLLAGINAHAATQTISLAEGIAVRTLAPHDLFAYLCVHGARHCWSRLKWLADLNAFVAASNLGIEQLYRHAQKIGAGLCAAQALLLCERLLGLKLPAELLQEFEADPRSPSLVAIAMRAITAPSAVHSDTGIGAVANNLRNQFLLGRGLDFYAAQCRLGFAGVADIVRLPLPRPLYFIYPLVRIPFWIYRRARLALATPRLRLG